MCLQGEIPLQTQMKRHANQHQLTMERVRGGLLMAAQHQIDLEIVLQVRVHPIRIRRHLGKLLLVSQCLADNLPLLTADRRLRRPHLAGHLLQDLQEVEVLHPIDHVHNFNFI